MRRLHPGNAGHTMKRLIHFTIFMLLAFKYGLEEILFSPLPFTPARDKGASLITGWMSSPLVHAVHWEGAVLKIISKTGYETWDCKDGKWVKR